MKPVTLASEAAEELAEAARWYESRQNGLAARFLEEFEQCWVWIGSRPSSFPRLLDTPPDLDMRRAVLAKFPYGVVFVDLAEEVRIIAIAHAKRHPGYWLDRVRV